MKSCNLNTSLIERRVQRGVTWLEENVTDWRTKISGDEIQITSRYSCVLGQVLGDYYCFTDTFSYRPWFATTRGFLRPICSSEEGRKYDTLLLKVWKKELGSETL